MSFRPEAIRGANGTGGVVDYRLTRQAVVREYRKGRLSKLDVCDAHPELRRAATGAGTPTAGAVPDLRGRGGHPRHLRLRVAAAGRRPVRHVGPRDGQARPRAARQVACYVVEVCPGCAWNHLTRVFHVGGYLTPPRCRDASATWPAGASER